MPHTLLPPRMVLNTLMIPLLDHKPLLFGHAMSCSIWVYHVAACTLLVLWRPLGDLRFTSVAMMPRTPRVRNTDPSGIHPRSGAHD